MRLEILAFKKLVSLSVFLAIVVLGFGPITIRAAEVPLSPEAVESVSVKASAARSVAPAAYSLTSDAEVLKAVNADAFGLRSGQKQNQKVSTQITAAAVTSPVAVLTIFSDPSYSAIRIASSNEASFDFGTHSFITVRNVSSSNINVGRFSGIAPGKTMSIGTWGNISEHKGLWYNAESWFVYNKKSFPGRISVSYLLTAQQLSSLNTTIINSDGYFAPTNNCSSFAVRAWNGVVDTSYRLSAGAPNTPKNLASSIKSKFPSNYSTGLSVPYNYVVYYANGTGSPTRSLLTDPKFKL